MLLEIIVNDKLDREIINTLRGNYNILVTITDDLYEESDYSYDATEDMYDIVQRNNIYLMQSLQNSVKIAYEEADKEFKIKRLIGFILFTAILAFTFPKLSESLLGGSENDNFMTYALSRAQTAEGLSDNADGANMSKSILYIVSIPLILSSLYFYFKKRKDVSPIFTNMCILMCIFVFSVSYSPLIQYRYFFVLYSFIIFTIPIIFKTSTQLSKLYCLTIIIFTIIYFLSTYSKNYDYAKVAEIISYPFPLYFTINPY